MVKAKKIIFTVILILFYISTIQGQKYISVIGQDNDTIFEDFNKAIEFAAPGDNIYLPGGIFDGVIIVDKPLNIYGTGYNPRYSGAFNRTIVNYLQVDSGANGTFITGMLCKYLRFENTNGLTIKRCFIESTHYSPNASDISFFECIIGSSLTIGNNSEIHNCLIGSSLTIGVNSKIENNIFTGYSGNTQKVEANNSSLSKNIFFANTEQNNIERRCWFYTDRTKNCLIYDNFFVDTCSFCERYNHPNTNELINNRFGVPYDSLFVNFPSDIYYGNFNYYWDFQLIPDSPCRNNTETLTDDAGVYGGVLGWKIGANPKNPKIISNNSQNSVTGNSLHINFKVEVQQR